MTINYKSNFIPLICILVIYFIITLISLNNCYFWDNIQLISKEAHWFYQTDFKSLLMPAKNSGAEIIGTGYHPPLMGIMTAILWKTFGYKLWISHGFIFLWLIILIYNVWKFTQIIFPQKFSGWVILIIMLEPTLLAQFSIASPDFILLTAFVISLRSIFERKPILLSIGFFFLCCISMRGIFVGAILIIVNFYYLYLTQNHKFRFRYILKKTLPYLPTLLLLLSYFIYYFMNRGWFFTETTSDDLYSLPNSLGRVLKHTAEFGLRSIENGRVLIWVIGIYIISVTLKSKKQLSQNIKVLALCFSLLTCLYVLFIFITQMPFSARYFMPQFLLLTIVSLFSITELWNKQKVTYVFVLVLIFELTGNFWIYPEKIAKSWDCTLAHMSYYPLRKDCFDYIDNQKLDYKDFSAGFCLCGNRKFAEMKNDGKSIGIATDRKYFIFSNISNLDDNFADSLKNKTYWHPIKSFQKGFTSITIYKNQKYK